MLCYFEISQAYVCCDNFLEMDPALLKDRADFSKRAKRQPVVERRPVAPAPDLHAPSAPSSSNGKFRARVSADASPSQFDYKAVGSAQHHTKFTALAKIVKYMKNRHLDGDTHALSLDDILEELNVYDLAIPTRIWLAQEALPANPKIQTFPATVATEDPKFTFRPRFDLKSRQDLVRLLRNNYTKSLGGIYLEDVQESLANSAKALVTMKERIVQTIRPQDKRVVLYYNDLKAALPAPVSEDFIKLWRSVTVDSMDEQKIEDHLAQHGIDAMQGTRKVFRPLPKTRRKGAGRKKLPKWKDNEHLADTLQDYSSNFEKNS